MKTKLSNTSWGNVAEWYDDLVEQDPDSFQKNVILPNLLRIVGAKKGMTILDLACGQGYFSRAFAGQGATVVGCDISQELIGKTRGFNDSQNKDESKLVTDFVKKDNQKDAIERKTERTEPIVTYHVSPADKLSFATDSSFDLATIVLALQNIENLAGTLAESSRVLKKGGRLVMVVNHPAFRIPKRSDWGWDEKNSKQFRRLDAYMSDDRVEIDMTPGEKIAGKKKFTVSFHRPLQSYFKALNKSGFAVTRLEEWISHRKSQTGSRADEEDRMRKEIPMFLCLEAVKS